MEGIPSTSEERWLKRKESVDSGHSTPCNNRQLPYHKWALRNPCRNTAQRATGTTLPSSKHCSGSTRKHPFETPTPTGSNISE